MSSYKTQKRLFSTALLAIVLGAQVFAQSSASRSSASCDGNAPKVQQESQSEPDTLARAERRAEELRDKLLALQMQELDLHTELADLDERLMPENIQRALVFVGSARPMDELRAGLREKLENDRARVGKRLELLGSRRERLEAAIVRADAEVERIRAQIERSTALAPQSSAR